MPARRRLRRAPFELGLKRDLIQQTAYFVLIARVLDGLAAWILYNEAFLPTATEGWPVHVLFVVYLGANSFFGLRYHAGRFTQTTVLADLAINVGTMIVVAACTGGILSPLVLVCLVKIAGYGFIFSANTAVVAISATFTAFAAMVAGNQAGWWAIDDLSVGMDRNVDVVFRAAVLGTLLIGAPWLFKRVADKEKQLTTEAKRAKVSAERARAAHAVATALLSVSEAVSRLTRLDEILNEVVEIAPRVLAVDYCGIFLWNEDNGTYQGAAVSGVEPTLARQLTSIRLARADVPDLEWVRRLGHCAVIAPRGIARLGLPDAPTLLTAPLMSGGRFYGVLQFARRGSNTGFNQNDLTIADGIAGQAAVALERARLVEESRRLVRAVESTGEAVLITDRHRRIVFVNEAFSHMFGYTHDELLGRDGLEFGSGMSDDWVRDVQRTMIDRNWRGEAIARRKDGSTFPVSLHASLIRTEENRIQGSVAIMEDISAEKDLQERLQRTDRLAAAGELAAGVAHEVNNALTGILGQAESARDSTDVERLREAMASVELQGHRIADIVQGLLGFARPRPPQREPIDLRALVRDTLTLMAHDLGRSGIRSETRFATDLPPVLVDAKQIQQVLVNLFTNAIQAMQVNGSGTLTINLHAQPGVVLLDVQDTGPGIAPDTVSRIFDPFFSTKPKGTGLGLSVSFAIMRAHGGDLTVRSAPSGGTIFTLQLPAVADAATTEARTVLLVDDDDAVAETLNDMLTKEGLTVRRAATGQEALDVLAVEAFDVIFLDVRLPDISGPEIFARLAAERPTMARRVIFVTGGLWRIDSRGLREKLPPQTTLSKPCTAAQIREVLRLLRDQRAAA